MHLHNVPGKPQLHSPIALERRCWTSWRGGRDEQSLKANGSELPRAVRDSSAIPWRAAWTHNRLFLYTVVHSHPIGDPNTSSVSKESDVWAWCVNVAKHSDRMQGMTEGATKAIIVPWGDSICRSFIFMALKTGIYWCIYTMCPGNHSYIHQ